MWKKNAFSIFLIVMSSLFLIHLPTTYAVTTLTKGININDWLNSDEAYHVQTTRYTRADFEDIKSLGCDHLRILVNFDTYENRAPEYDVSPLYFTCLDRALTLANEVGLKIIIANTGPEITDLTMPMVQEQLVANWKKVAAHFAGQGDIVLYEILSQPGAEISADNWNTVAAAVIAAIREVDSQHTIIVGPVNNYSVDALAGLTKFEDNNLMYSFEFFDPVTFTYQGLSYHEVDYNTVVIPFPHTAGRMPTIDPLDVGTPAEAAFNNYSTTGTVDYVKQRIDLVAQFATDKGVPVYCARFGVTIGTNWNGDRSMGWYVLDEYRAAWLEAARTEMEAKGIPWCLASFRGNFGIHDDYGYDPDLWMKFSVFKYDVNITITTALGLTATPPDDYWPEQLSEGFMVYDDEITELARVGWWLGDGEPSFFDENEPAVGQYCLGIYYPGQYNAVDFFFPLYLDMSALADEGYYLDFMIRCDDPEGHIQARFEDTNEDLDERPWRMNYHVDNNVVPFDGDWQQVTLLLTDMQDQGAWDPDDRTWYGGGQGLPDWSAVQRLQFVSETQPQPDTEIFLDRIRIVSPTAVETKTVRNPLMFRLMPNYPNPFNAATQIEYTLPTKAQVELRLYNIKGEFVKQLFTGLNDAGLHRVTWDGTDSNNQPAASGIYLYELKTEHQRLVRSMVLIR